MKCFSLFFLFVCWINVFSNSSIIMFVNDALVDIPSKINGHYYDAKIIKTNRAFSSYMFLIEDENISQLKVADYIKFNLQLGAVMNSLSANYTRRESTLGRVSSEKYSESTNKNTCNINFGFNFLFGKKKFVKYALGANYLRSVGEYNYTYYHGGFTSYYEDYHYVSKIDFINFVTGFRFMLFNSFHIEPLVSLNVIVRSDVRISGTSSVKYISGGPTPSVYYEEIEYHSNQKLDSEHSNISSTISLCPKFTYEFNLYKQPLGVYVGYNLAYRYKLPWVMFGMTYYPFKKLR